MLGGNCNPCCGCTPDEAAELNELLRGRTVDCKISQLSYSPQSGVFLANNNARLAVGWKNPQDSREVTLADCRASIDDASFYNTFGLARYREEQISQEPYRLYLDASTSEPVYRYADDHIEIVFSCQFVPFVGVKVEGVVSDCLFIWNLRVYKFRRTSITRLGDLWNAQIQETTYGPEFLADSPTNPRFGDTTAAAVLRYIGWDYSTEDGRQYDNQRPLGQFAVRSIDGVGYKLLGDIAQAGSQFAVGKPLVYYNALQDFGAGTVTLDTDQDAFTVALDSRTAANNSFCFHDRTVDSLDVEPRLVESPSYSISRVDVGTVRAQQTGSPFQKTYAFDGSQFSMSAVVTLSS